MFQRDYYESGSFAMSYPVFELSRCQECMSFTKNLTPMGGSMENLSDLKRSEASNSQRAYVFVQMGATRPACWKHEDDYY